MGVAALEALPVIVQSRTRGSLPGSVLPSRGSGRGCCSRIAIARRRLRPRLLVVRRGRQLETAPFRAKGAVRGTGWQDAAGVSAELPDSRSGISSLHTTLRQKGHVGCLALG